MTQKSSIRAPILGKISLTSRPLCPHFWNWNGERIRLPDARSVLILGPGIGWPSFLVSTGLGSNVSTCEIPPLRKRKITFFAFAGNCGAFGASGFRLASACSTPAKPSIPNPLAHSLSDSRLVILIHRDELTGTQQCLAIARPGIVASPQKFQPELDI